ncbi:MAG: LytTR family DNA-binding domain-containing protein [Lutisporaceae bacterium]
MELVIGVCDDEAVQVDILSSFLEQNLSDYQLKLIKAYSGEELLTKLQNVTLDIVLLDIEMKELNGLQTGKRIRDKYPDVIIVFISGHKRFALDAFKLKSTDYIVKPISEKRMKLLLRDLLIRIDQIRLYEEKNKSITFHFKENIIKLKFNEIYIFEKYLRKITVYSEKGQFVFYGNMDKLISRLDMEMFTRCHNSYIVNSSKILEMKNDSIYIRELDKTIPVSRKKKLTVREIIEKNLFL